MDGEHRLLLQERMLAAAPPPADYVSAGRGDPARIILYSVDGQPRPGPGLPRGGRGGGDGNSNSVAPFKVQGSARPHSNGYSRAPSLIRGERKTDG